MLVAVARNVSASTQNQGLSALPVLYQTELELPLGELADVVRARRPLRLPMVLSLGNFLIDARFSGDSSRSNGRFPDLLLDVVTAP